MKLRPWFGDDPIKMDLRSTHDSRRSSLQSSINLQSEDPHIEDTPIEEYMEDGLEINTESKGDSLEEDSAKATCKDEDQVVQNQLIKVPALLPSPTVEIVHFFNDPYNPDAKVNSKIKIQWSIIIPYINGHSIPWINCEMSPHQRTSWAATNSIVDKEDGVIQDNLEDEICTVDAVWCKLGLI